jgi:hypothetical protein
VKTFDCGMQSDTQAFGVPFEGDIPAQLAADAELGESAAKSLSCRRSFDRRATRFAPNQRGMIFLFALEHLAASGTLLDPVLDYGVGVSASNLGSDEVAGCGGEADGRDMASPRTLRISAVGSVN